MLLTEKVRMKRIAATLYRNLLLLPAVIFLLSCNGDEDPVNQKPDPDETEEPQSNTEFTHIYAVNSEGYSCFRIPAIIKTKAGTLLAFAEGRKTNCSDEDDIDLVVKRSSDDGKTWSKLSVVWSDGENTCGNPAPVVDQATGKIHLLMTWNFGADDIGTINNGTSTDTRRVYYTGSEDDGVTWATPKEITTSVKLATWGWYATGPCHGIQLTKGAHAGRLVIPCDNIELKSAGGKGYSHVIYSDDAGVTWKLGGVTPQYSLNPNESTVAELSDGKLMLNMRVSGNNNLRLVSRSTDAGITWAPVATAYGLVDPVCQASLLSATVDNKHTLFFSNASATTRTNMTIKMSQDDGASWTKQYSVYTGLSGYSDIVMLSNTQVGILYEAGTTKYWDGIAYRIVNISDFM
jgi:sialidase-1